MTRHTWTTKDQKEWLEPKKAAFIAAKQIGNNVLKDFCLTVFKEFREKWPVPPVTEFEITEAGTIELATKIKCDKYDKVPACYFYCNK